MFDQVISLESGRDVLTRLLNRRYLQSVMLRELNYLRRNESSLSVLTIDIDSFKFINDSYGHAVGDE
ncbi:TPA: diguanylate cyclase, partial [Pseudomonas aeruginosa]|nr:diguanylate cyclase [Pseudomonas aeruginosa]